MNEQMKVTVGICAYNTEQYIIQCVESAINQDYKNLEIIIVDDGSTDRTGELLDQITDERVRVLHKQNAGLSAGREDVMRLMSGDAVYWLDSDDWLLPGAVSNSVRLMEETGADIVKTALFKSDLPFCGTYTREEYLKLMLPDVQIQSHIIGCLFRKSIYEGLHHLVGFTTGDYYIFPRLADNSRLIVLESSGSYMYRLNRPGSITSNGRNSFKGHYPRALHHRDRYDRYKAEFPEECKTVLKQLVDHSCMACLFADGDPRAEQCRQILINKYADIMASDSIGWYKKWLTRQVISSGKLLWVMRILHHAKGRLMAMKEQLNSPSLSGE